MFDEQRIAGWQAQNDLPNFCAELEFLGIGLNDDQMTMMLGGDDRTTVSGDKLLGWPDWVHNVEYTACPRCSQRMNVIFQIESCRGIPVMLGDGGRGWVSQCPEHTDVLNFHWQG